MDTTGRPADNAVYCNEGAPLMNLAPALQIHSNLLFVAHQSTAAVRGSERRPVLPLAIQVRVSIPSRISYLVSRPALAHL